MSAWTLATYSAALRADGMKDGSVNSDGDADGFERKLWGGAMRPLYVAKCAADYLAFLCEEFASGREDSGLVVSIREVVAEGGISIDDVERVIRAYVDSYANGLARRIESLDVCSFCEKPTCHGECDA